MHFRFSFYSCLSYFLFGIAKCHRSWGVSSLIPVNLTHEASWEFMVQVDPLLFFGQLELIFFTWLITELSLVSWAYDFYSTGQSDPTNCCASIDKNGCTSWWIGNRKMPLSSWAQPNWYPFRLKMFPLQRPLGGWAPAIFHMPFFIQLS